jgi:putative transposon-encoded protein
MVKIRKLSIKKGIKILKNPKSPTTKNKVAKRFELNSKELKVNLDQLQKDVKKAYGSMMKVVPESIKDVEIKRFGNASHIILPKNYSGKKATVIVRGK